MSKSFARTGKRKFYWTDSAVNSLHQAIFFFPPSTWFYNKAATDSADILIIILISLEKGDAT